MSLVGYVWLAWNIFEVRNHHAAQDVCMFKGITHIPCPSCGTTRSMLLLVKGQIRESMLINPFGAVLALGLLIIPFWILTDILRKHDSFFRCYISAENLLKQRKWISTPAAAIVLLNWAWNIIKGI